VGYQEWLSEVQARFKSWTTFLETLGAFHIYETPWFRFLLAVLAFIILVSLGNRVMRLLRPLYAGQQDILRNAVQVTVLAVNAPAAQVVEGAWAAVTPRFGRTVRRECDRGTCLYGAQNAWAAASVLVTYVGLLLLLAGLAINGRWGWQQSGIRLLPGEPIFVGREASHRVQLLSTQDDSEVILDVGEDRRVALKPGVRIAEDGFRYQLTDQGGPLVQVSAWRDTGSKLTLYDYTVRPSAVESLQFAFSPGRPQDEQDRLFIVSDEKVVGRLKWLNGLDQGTGSGSRFHLWVFLEDGRTAVGETELVARDGPVTAKIGDITYSLQVTRYQVINVDHQPGLPALRISAGLISLGLLAALIPRSEIWLLISETAGRVTIRAGEQKAGLFQRFRDSRRDVLQELEGRFGRT
jgi:cytochrome c biogenesis protein ResB